MIVVQGGDNLEYCVHILNETATPIFTTKAYDDEHTDYASRFYNQTIAPNGLFKANFGASDSHILCGVNDPAAIHLQFRMDGTSGPIIGDGTMTLCGDGGAAFPHFEFINVHTSLGFSLTQEHGNIHIAKIAK